MFTQLAYLANFVKFLPSSCRFTQIQNKSQACFKHYQHQRHDRSAQQSRFSKISWTCMHNQLAVPGSSALKLDYQFVHLHPLVSFHNPSHKQVAHQNYRHHHPMMTHINVPDSSSVAPLPAPFTHQSVSSPTVSSTTRNYLVGSQCNTPQQHRVNRSDLLYSPIFQSPDSSTSPAGPFRIPQYTSYPTGGPPTGHDQNLLINSPELQLPMLQEALQSEARQNILPLNLLQATLPPSGQFQAPQIPLSARSGMLQVALMHLEKSHRSKASELQRFYQIQSAKIEADRVSQLCNIRHVPSVLTIVNQYYDVQHHALIDNIDLQVRCLRYQFSASASTAKSESSNKENVTQPAKKEAKAIKQRKGKPKPLNDQAVRIMTNWYERHIEHPYPNASAAEVLAKTGNITVEQVKKWFANKRMRSANTKPQREMAAAQRKHLLPCDPSSEQPDFKKIRF